MYRRMARCTSRKGEFNESGPLPTSVVYSTPVRRATPGKFAAFICDRVCLLTELLISPIIGADDEPFSQLGNDL